jgi:hypothetical protein
VSHAASPGQSHPCAFHARSHAKRAALQRDDSRFTLTQEGRPPAEAASPLAKEGDSTDLFALFSQDLPKQETAADIHTHLSNLSLALQQGRISPRRAAVLAYINSLLLRTLPAIEKQNSPHDSGGIDMTGAPRPIRNLAPPQHSPLAILPWILHNSRLLRAVRRCCGPLQGAIPISESSPWRMWRTFRFAFRPSASVNRNTATIRVKTLRLPTHRRGTACHARTRNLKFLNAAVPLLYLLNLLYFLYLSCSSG